MNDWLNSLSGGQFAGLFVLSFFIILMIECAVVELYHKFKRGPRRRYNRHGL